MRATIHAERSKGQQRHFWQSTGFTPARLLLDDDMKQTLAYIGAVPRRGIRLVRIHLLMDLIGGEGFDTDTPTYDWSRLDEGIDVLMDNRLEPFFELMGNPGGWFSDFYDDKQLGAWRRVVRDLALHLMDRYGRQTVEGWYFETWNEPDAGWWHQWPREVQSFLNYFDACSEGLRDANPRLRFGGPGSCKHLTDWLKTFFAHVDSGRNYFTAQPGRLDFVSIHEKGAEPTPEDITPDTPGIVRREGIVHEYLRANHPRLAELPLMNNECDPQIAWRHVHTWRGRSYYAAQVVRAIDLHQRWLMDDAGVNYELLGNDNGFLGPWGYRSQLARFLPKGAKEDAGEPRPNFALVKKPVLTVMELLALLGDERLVVDGLDPGDDERGMLATRFEGGLAVMVYWHRDAVMSSDCGPVEVQFAGLPAGPLRCVHYRIDPEHTNPFELWDAGRQYGVPGPELLATLRRAAEPALLEDPRDVTPADGRWDVRFDLPLHGVSLLMLLKDPGEVASAADGLRASVYPGLHDQQEEVLLRWSPSDSRCLRTWVVEYAPGPDGPWERVNRPDVISCAFLHTRPAGASGAYRVRALDWWGRAGEPSNVITI